MNDLLDDDGPENGPGNAPEFSVSEISGAVKKTVEGAFSRVRVRGEIGRLSRPRSGHVYLDLKDDRAVLAGVIWKGVAGRLSNPPEEGMEVIATGRLTTFPGQSKYQMVIEDLRPAGVGALMAMLEKRKAALAAEGLFAQERKAKLPWLPEVIGVVTSPSGAVIRDILHRLRDRFPRQVLIWPVAVQGAKCAPEVAAAIRGFNALPLGGRIPRPDLLIVARGGGSLEDLWGFNEEAVVRAAAESAIPLISAVGHETDTTLIDYAADKRAPTPTAAAEMAVPVRMELLAWVETAGGRLSRAVTSGLRVGRQRMGDLSRGLPRLEAVLEGPRQRLDAASDRLAPSLRSATQTRRIQLERLTARLQPGLERAIAGKRAMLGQAGARLSPQRLGTHVARGRADLDRLAARLRPERQAERVQAGRDRLQTSLARFRANAVARLEQRRARLAALERMRQTLGYRETLRRGYAVVRAGPDVVTGKEQAARAGRLEIEFGDGKLGVVPDGGGAKPRGRAGPGRGPEQGSLF